MLTVVFIPFHNMCLPVHHPKWVALGITNSDTGQKLKRVFNSKELFYLGHKLKRYVEKVYPASSQAQA